MSPADPSARSPLRSTDISLISRVLRRVDLVSDGSTAGDAVRTGFPSIDRTLGGGLRYGDLVVLTGDVGSGKSALALAIAMRMAQGGERAVLLSTEMTVDRLLERAVAIEGRARIDDLRQGALDEESRANVGGAAVRLRDAMPALDVAPTNVEDLLRYVQDEGLTECVLVLDSLQGLVPTTTLPLEEEESHVVRALKRLALERDLAVLLTSHLRRSPEASEARPSLADLGAKDAVRHHADVVTAIYREEMYHPGSGVEGGTEFLILKNRNGVTGYVDLYFYKQWLRFEDMLDPDR